MASITRRDLIKNLSIAGTATLLGLHGRQALTSPEKPAVSESQAKAAESAKNLSNELKPVVTLKRVNAFDPGTGAPALRAYAEVVRLMKALPSSDSRNWFNFAEIHNNFCPHGNWYFLPWHRAYLMALENVGRNLLGNANFALPYWDWTQNGRMPPQFFDTNSPLYNATRTLKPSQSLCELLSGPDCEGFYGPSMVREVIRSRPFQNFGSTMPNGQNDNNVKWQRARGSKDRLEFGPHDNTHGLIGGEMGSVPTSARDPIFYLHHANIDRFWSAWSECGGGAESDARWRNFTFPKNFPLADGSSRFDVLVSSLLDTTSLGYIYDDLRNLTSACLLGKTLESKRLYKTRVIGEWKTPQTVTLGKVSAAPVTLSRTLSVASLATGAKVDAQQREETRIFAMIRGITIPAATNQSVSVFINLAEGTKSSDSHYVTSFGFFGANAGHEGHEGHGTTMDLRIDLTEALQALSDMNKIPTDQLHIQLLSAGHAGDKIDSKASAFSYNSIELVEQAAVNQD